MPTTRPGGPAGSPHPLGSSRLPIQNYTRHVGRKTTFRLINRAMSRRYQEAMEARFKRLRKAKDSIFAAYDSAIRKAGALAADLPRFLERRSWACVDGGLYSFCPGIWEEETGVRQGTAARSSWHDGKACEYAPLPLASFPRLCFKARLILRLLASRHQGAPR